MDESPPSLAGRVALSDPAPRQRGREIFRKSEPENPGERLSGKTGMMRTFPSFPLTTLGAQLSTFKSLESTGVDRASCPAPSKPHTVHTPRPDQVPFF